MDEINNQFNKEDGNKKFAFLYIIISIIFVIGVVFMFVSGTNDSTPVSVSSGVMNRENLLDELSKERTSKQPIDKEKVREELAKPSNFTLTEEDKQAIRESLAQ